MTFLTLKKQIGNHIYLWVYRISIKLMFSISLILMRYTYFFWGTHNGVASLCDLVVKSQSVLFDPEAACSIPDEGRFFWPLISFRNGLALSVIIASLNLPSVESKSHSRNYVTKSHLWLHHVGALFPQIQHCPEYVEFPVMHEALQENITRNVGACSAHSGTENKIIEF